MNATVASLLHAASRWLLLASLLVFVAGFAWIVAAAPCSRLGAYLLQFGIALGLLAVAVFLVRAFMGHPVRSIVAASVVVAICALEYFVSYTFTSLLCRGG